MPPNTEQNKRGGERRSEHHTPSKEGGVFVRYEASSTCSPKCSPPRTLGERSESSVRVFAQVFAKTFAWGLR